MRSTTLRSDRSVWRLTPDGWQLVWAPPSSPLAAPAGPQPVAASRSGGPQSSRLEGADFSHWNDQTQFLKVIQGLPWAALKATQGTGYLDPMFRSRWALLGSRIQAGQMTLRIAYHFLAPGDGATQARFFLRTLGVSGPLAPGARLALDWEAQALSDAQALRTSAETVHQVTGLYPLVYCSASQVSRARSAAPSAPSWVAKWSAPAPTDVPFVQYAEGPGYDHDYFNGDLAALRRFAGLEGAGPAEHHPMLGLGSRGEDVWAVQQRLVQWLRASGREAEAQAAAQRFQAAYQSNGGRAYYGQVTRDLVAAYQREHKVRRADGREVPLKDDGVVGDDTWSTLDLAS